MRQPVLVASLALLLGAADAAPQTRSAAPAVSLPATSRDMPPPAAAGAMAPAWAVGGAEPRLSWLEPVSEGGLRMRLATLRGSAWDEPVTVASGTDFFANWADCPAVAIGPDGSLLAHWLSKNGSGTYAYGIELARSSDTGKTWQRMGRLHDDSSLNAEHGFVSYVPTADGIRTFWLDGRNTKSDGTGAMSLRTALVGKTVGPSEEIDSRVCDCCQTAAASTATGPLVVYRDRADDEIRDMAVIRREGGGWSAPTVVAADSWRIPGCPVNGPAVAAEGNHATVVWFSGKTSDRIELAVSQDGGKTFGPAVVLDGGAPLGRVDLVSVGGGAAVASWLATVGEAAEIRLARIDASGRAGTTMTVARTSAARSSGVPRLRRQGETLLVAWVDVATGRKASLLHVTEIPLALLSSAPKP